MNLQVGTPWHKSYPEGPGTSQREPLQSLLRALSEQARKSVKKGRARGTASRSRKSRTLPSIKPHSQASTSRAPGAKWVTTDLETTRARTWNYLQSPLPLSVPQRIHALMHRLHQNCEIERPSRTMYVPDGPGTLLLRN